MTDISQYLDNDLTLRAMSEEIIKTSTKKPRNYLGMSEIGEQCWRMLWYRFRNVLEETLTLKSLLAIEDGYQQEDIMAARLSILKDVKLDTVDPETGEQFGVKLIGGHFAGHLDGKIIGIYESPKTQHIWENKAVNEDKFNKLKKLILSEGEKQALALWDETYYAQAVIYMKAFKLTRHYMTVESPGGRDYTSCRTEANNKDAVSLIAKAETIIKADRPPQRLSENRSFYKCGWCRMKEICFDNKVPAVNCRTCAFGEPITDDKTMNATWKCYKKNIDFTGQGQVCDEHLFLNTLVPFKTVAADEGVPNWIKYALPTGGSFCNINSKSKAKGYTSKQLYDLEYFELAMKTDDEGFKAIQKDKEETKKIKGLI
jgi:hypothetical protein